MVIYSVEARVLAKFRVVGFSAENSQIATTAGGDVAVVGVVTCIRQDRFYLVVYVLGSGVVGVWGRIWGIWLEMCNLGGWHGMCYREGKVCMINE